MAHVFLRGRRSESIFGKVACVGCIILIIVQNDAIKIISSVHATPWLAKIAVP